MLDHHEERQLAEIEAHLRDEAPDLLELFEVIPEATEPPPVTDRLVASSAPSPVPTGYRSEHPVLRSLGALALAMVITTVVTLAVGPNLGGLVAVISISIAGMFAYQVLRGCPGLRDRRDES